MPNTIELLKAGSVPQALLDEVGPFSIAAHDDHVASLDAQGAYDVFGNRFDAPPGTYHPHPWSSSVFMVRSLLREGRHLGRLLDVGCGTGVVALSMLHHGLADEVVMTDVGDEAIQAARQNAEALGMGSFATACTGNLLEGVDGQQFDSLVFNMPLMHRVHQASQHSALDDACGAIAREFFREAPGYLKPGGCGYFTYSNISDPALLEEFGRHTAISLVAAEWVVSTGFWLMVYRFGLGTTSEACPDCS
jgi:methylase of polypeptide subunit release factors